VAENAALTKTIDLYVTNANIEKKLKEEIILKYKEARRLLANC
jgi:hypothetical protein